MPASRPRMCSGMVWFQTVPRNTAEIMSAAPASTRNTSASQIVGIRPASPMTGAVRRRRDHDRPAVVVDPRRSSRSSAVASRAPTVSAE